MATYHDYMDHEYMRWDAMSTSQLLTRLRRIKKPEKMEAFISVAGERRRPDLVRAASRRAVELGLDYLHGVDTRVVNEARDNRPSLHIQWTSEYRNHLQAEQRVREEGVEPTVEQKPVIRKIRFSGRRPK